MLLKRNTCAHTYTKCLHHPLTAFAHFSVFFLFFFFTYAYSCARLTLMQSFLSVSFLFVPLCSLLLSLSHTHTYAWCVHGYACPNFVFVVSFLLLVAHNDGDTRIEGRNLTKKKEECACIHVIVHSIRQNAFEVSLCFFSAFRFFFIQGHNKDRRHSINQIVYI
jgi:hypothetical protein